MMISDRIRDRFLSTTSPGIVIATPVITLKTRAMAKFSGNGNPKGACDVGGLAKGFRREHISTGLANMEQKEVI